MNPKVGNNREVKINFFVLLLLFASPVFAKFVGGIGYIQPGKYRVDNNVSPLPLGWNVVPMIGYFGERLQVVGPNITYKLIKDPLYNFFINLSAIGDRYESHNIGLRDTSLNANVGLRILFLTLKYGHDISGRYKGNTLEFIAAWRFILSEKLFIMPRYRRLHLDSRYVNFYYGITQDEADGGPYTFYQSGNAINESVGLTTTYKLFEGQSIALSADYTFLHENIYKSPTTSRKSYLTASLFWNYTF